MWGCDRALRMLPPRFRSKMVIGDLRVPKTVTFKMRLGAQPFLWKWVLFAWEWKMISISKAEHLRSFCNRGPGELGNGLLKTFTAVPTLRFKCWPDASLCTYCRGNSKMLTGIANKVIVFSHGYLKEGQISEFLALLQLYSSDDDGKNRMSVKFVRSAGKFPSNLCIEPS